MPVSEASSGREPENGLQAWGTCCHVACLPARATVDTTLLHVMSMRSSYIPRSKYTGLKLKEKEKKKETQI